MTNEKTVNRNSNDALDNPSLSLGENPAGKSKILHRLRSSADLAEELSMTTKNMAILDQEKLVSREDLKRSFQKTMADTCEPEAKLFLESLVGRMNNLNTEIDKEVNEFF